MSPLKRKRKGRGKKEPTNDIRLYNENILPTFIRPSRQKKSKKKERRTILSEKSVKNILAQESLDGSWTDINLVGRLYNEDLRDDASKGEEVIIVITYLVAIWVS